MAAPKGNLHTVRNGTALTRLTLGAMPQTMLRHVRNARAYRRNLESLVMQAKGKVNMTDAHLIDEAAGAEVHASVCRWLMRTRLNDMTVSDIARCSEQVMKARTIRNRAVERLGLDRDQFQDAIEAMYTVRPSSPNADGAGGCDK